MHLVLCKPPPEQFTLNMACRAAHTNTVNAQHKVVKATHALITLLESMKNDNSASLNRLKSQE